MAASPRPPAIPPRRVGLTIGAVVLAVLLGFPIVSGVASVPAFPPPPPDGGPRAPVSSPAPGALDPGIPRGAAPGVAGTPSAVYGNWTNLTGSLRAAPTARTAFEMVYDPDLSAIVLFGGLSTLGSAFGDTWEFASGAWRHLSLNASPPARWGQGMVYDPSVPGIVLFGGRDPSGFFNDTWMFNASGWTQIATSGPAPPARTGSMVYDGADGYVLLQGGYNPTRGYFVDTWTFGNGTWSNITTSVVGAPKTPWDRTLVYDPPDGNVVLAGGVGACSGPFVTWTYRAGNWTNVTRSVSPDFAAGPGAIDFDPSLAGILAVSGYTASCALADSMWMYSSGTWSNISAGVPSLPQPRWDGRMAYDPMIPGDLLWGGNENPVGGSNAFGADTWLFTPTLRPEPSADPAKGLAPLNVSFALTAPLAGTPPYTYNWSFGDGSPNSTLAAPSHWYNDSGTYQVAVSVHDSGNLSGVGTTTVQVYDPLTANATALPVAGEAPLTVSFGLRTAGGVPTIAYHWTFGDGNTSTSRNVTHTYAGGGTFNWSVSVTDSVGENVTLGGSVEVVSGLIASFTVSPASGAAPFTVQCSSSVSGGQEPYTYDWSFGDGSPRSNTTSPSHTYQQVGVYTIALNVTDDLGVVRHLTKTVAAVPELLSGGSVTPLQGPAPLTVDYVAIPSGGEAPYTVSWSFGDGSTPASQGVGTHVYAQPGTYSVNLTVGDALGDVARTSYSVLVALPLTVGVSASATRALAPATIDFTSSQSGGVAPYTLRWTIGGVASAATTGSIEHTFSDPGTYTVAVEETDQYGTTAGASVDVVVAAALSVSISVGTTGGTVGTVTSFAAHVVGGFPAYTYHWSGLPTGCVDPGADSFECAPTAPGDFVLRVAVNDSLGNEINGTFGFPVVAATTPGSPASVGSSPGATWLYVGLGLAVAGAAISATLVLRRRRPPPPEPGYLDDAPPEDESPPG